MATDNEGGQSTRWTRITDYAGGLDRDLDLANINPRLVPHIVGLHHSLENFRITLGNRERQIAMLKRLGLQSSKWADKSHE